MSVLSPVCLGGLKRLRARTKIDDDDDDYRDDTPRRPAKRRRTISDRQPLEDEAIQVLAQWASQSHEPLDAMDVDQPEPEVVPSPLSLWCSTPRRSKKRTNTVRPIQTRRRSPNNLVVVVRRPPASL